MPDKPFETFFYSVKEIFSKHQNDFSPQIIEFKNLNYNEVLSGDFAGLRNLWSRQVFTLYQFLMVDPVSMHTEVK
jgi:hypothetical protein